MTQELEPGLGRRWKQIRPLAAVRRIQPSTEPLAGQGARRPRAGALGRSLPFRRRFHQAREFMDLASEPFPGGYVRRQRRRQGSPRPLRGLARAAFHAHMHTVVGNRKPFAQPGDQGMGRGAAAVAPLPLDLSSRIQVQRQRMPPESSMRCCLQFRVGRQHRRPGRLPLKKEAAAGQVEGDPQIHRFPRRGRRLIFVCCQKLRLFHFSDPGPSRGPQSAFLEGMRHQLSLNHHRAAPFSPN